MSRCAFNQKRTIRVLRQEKKELWGLCEQPGSGACSSVSRELDPRLLVWKTVRASHCSQVPCITRKQMGLAAPVHSIGPACGVSNWTGFGSGPKGSAASRWDTEILQAAGQPRASQQILSRLVACHCLNNPRRAAYTKVHCPEHILSSSRDWTLDERKALAWPEDGQFNALLSTCFFFFCFFSLSWTVPTYAVPQPQLHPACLPNKLPTSPPPACLVPPADEGKHATSYMA